MADDWKEKKKKKHHQSPGVWTRLHPPIGVQLIHIIYILIIICVSLHFHLGLSIKVSPVCVWLGPHVFGKMIDDG